MSKYIDADKLIEGIKHIQSKFPVITYEALFHLVTSLQQEQPEADLEKAARYVYESWMGGTMDDVRRDMVELGKVIKARNKE